MPAPGSSDIALMISLVHFGVRKIWAQNLIIFSPISVSLFFLSLTDCITYPIYGMRNITSTSMKAVRIKEKMYVSIHPTTYHDQ